MNKAERLVNNLLRANNSLWDYGTNAAAKRVGMRTNQVVKYIRRLEKYVGRLQKRIEKYEQQADLQTGKTKATRRRWPRMD